MANYDVASLEVCFFRVIDTYRGDFLPGMFLHSLFQRRFNSYTSDQYFVNGAGIGYLNESVFLCG